MKKTRIAICSLLLALSFILSSLAIPPARARDTGRTNASIFYSTQYLMQPSELTEIHSAFQQVENMFSQQYIFYWAPWFPYHPVSWDYVYGHLENFEAATTLGLVTSQIVDCEANHQFSTVFYYGHQNQRSIPGYSYPIQHYGFVEQAAPNANPETVGTVWDDNIAYAPTQNNHHFVFLWSCITAETTGHYYPEPYGFPYCWAKRILSSDGYYSPDGSSYCFIGFEQHSATFIENLGVPNQTYKYWMVFFYYAALNYQYSIKQAADQASKWVGYEDGWADVDNRLSKGWGYWWYGGGGLDPGPYWGKMHIYGNGNIYLPVTHNEVI